MNSFLLLTQRLPLGCARDFACWLERPQNSSTFDLHSVAQLPRAALKMTVEKGSVTALFAFLTRKEQG
jgi:hypothetical protein